jgi:hypothetical protein
MQILLRGKGSERLFTPAATHPVVYISVNTITSTRSNVKKKTYPSIIGQSHVQFGTRGKNKKSGARTPTNQY